MSDATVEAGPTMDPLTEEEVQEIAQGVIRGDLVIDHLEWTGTRLNGTRYEWLIAALMTKSVVPANASTMVWESRSKRGEMAINGRMTFMSLNWVPIESEGAVSVEIHRLNDLLGGAV